METPSGGIKVQGGLGSPALVPVSYLVVVMIFAYTNSLTEALAVTHNSEVQLGTPAEDALPA
jgi:hypothetical protein